MDETDREILKILQDDVPLISRPFLEVAKKLDIKEEEVIRRIKKMMSEGIVRRFSASIRHRKLGITANPLVAWKVPERRVEEVGEKLASFEEVTHCYERAIIPGKWKYNIYTMIHGYDRDDVKKTAKKLSDAVGIKDYELLYSSKEFKKTYKRYG